MNENDRLCLIDGSGYIFRAYHALPALTRKSDDLPVGAVHGFCAMLMKVLREANHGAANHGERLTHLAVILDHSATTFRKRIYAAYKANRPEPPEDLIVQFGLIRQAIRAFNVPCIEQEDYEADDLIATYTRQAREAGAPVRIVSSDKDLMQLVDSHVTMIDTMKAMMVGPRQVEEKFGVPPGKVIDVQALAGDSVDNIPGVPGIGIKTGAMLINEYGDLDSLLDRAGEIRQKKRREALLAFADQARLSRQLVTLKDDVPVENKITDFALRSPDAPMLIGFLKAMEFTSLTKRVAAGLKADDEHIKPVAVETGDWKGAAFHRSNGAAGGAGTSQTPGSRAALAGKMVRAIPVDRLAYETVTTLERLEEWIAEGCDRAVIAVDTETTSLSAFTAELVGISLALEPGRACYIPLAHRSAGGLDFTPRETVQIDRDTALEKLRPMLEDQAVMKVGQNIKYDWLILIRHGIRLAPVDDTMLMSCTLDSGRGGHGLDALSRRHIGHETISYRQVTGSGKQKVTFDLVPIDEATAYAGEDADITLRLWQVLKLRLVAEGKMTVYETLERAIIPIIGEMERVGVMVDDAVLAHLSNEFAKSMLLLEEEIYQLAGERFNVASPKQLGAILFEKMGLSGEGKTKTGAWGTGAKVLERLAGQGHDLPLRVLQWRQLAKLKSTYTDALPEHIDSEKRVHTSWHLAATSTGRLASSDPNLQNIPIRTPEGRKIRTAFVAPPGCKLISADYSQIELRVLAHIADIAELQRAFADGVDIHALTASEMFSHPIKGMDPMIRRRAKEINFGIIYGISAFGLANRLGIAREEAADYIKRYFERFPGIRDYMEATKAYCREHGYVETLFGRRCHFPGITVKTPAERAFNERAAINAPIQGTAADIIRRAMIRMPEAFAKAGLKLRMALQVHDELIFEANDAEVGAVTKLAVGVMERACEPAVALKVPLRVDARAADNWDEAH
ncbi:MAG: DNA polymerase I [Hyphomicrobiales bacterium]